MTQDERKVKIRSIIVAWMPTTGDWVAEDVDRMVEGIDALPATEEMIVRVNRAVRACFPESETPSPLSDLIFWHGQPAIYWVKHLQKTLREILGSAS